MDLSVTASSVNNDLCFVHKLAREKCKALVPEVCPRNQRKRERFLCLFSKDALLVPADVGAGRP